MSKWLTAVAAAIVGVSLVCSVWSSPPSETQKLSQVVAAADLVSELESKVSEIESRTRFTRIFSGIGE